MNSFLERFGLESVLYGIKEMNNQNNEIKNTYGWLRAYLIKYANKNIKINKSDQIKECASFFWSNFEQIFSKFQDLYTKYQKTTDSNTLNYDMAKLTASGVRNLQDNQHSTSYLISIRRFIYQFFLYSQGFAENTQNEPFSKEDILLFKDLGSLIL